MKIIGTPEEIQTFKDGCRGAMCNECALSEYCDKQRLDYEEYTESELTIISKFLGELTLARQEYEYIDENGVTHKHRFKINDRFVLNKPGIKSILITNKGMQEK